MLRSPSALEQRAAALILLGLVLAAAYWLLVHNGFVGPLLDIDGRLQVLAEQEIHYRELLGRREVLQQQLQDVRAQGDDKVGLLPGEDGNAVAAVLMQRVTEHIKGLDTVGIGCSVLQRMPILTERGTPGPYRPVRLSVDLDCGIEPLVHLLYSLEYARPLLFVEELNVTRNPAAAVRQTLEQSRSAAPKRLTVHVLIAGYMAEPKTVAGDQAQGDPGEPESDRADQAEANEGVDR
jgi:general secretion pathway protein M